MANTSFFVRHYEFILTAWHIALMALFLWVVLVPNGFRIGLLICASLVLGSILHFRRSDEPPCGAEASDEGIVRPPPHESHPR